MFSYLVPGFKSCKVVHGSELPHSAGQAPALLWRTPAAVDSWSHKLRDTQSISERSELSDFLLHQTWHLDRHKVGTQKISEAKGQEVQEGTFPPQTLHSE